MTARTRFRVTRITRAPGYTGRRAGAGELWHVQLSAVHSNEPDHENSAFWPHASTERPDPEHAPGGAIYLTCIAPLPDTFPLGGEVFVDFTPAEPLL